MENQPLHIIVEVSTDEESEHQGEEVIQTGEEVTEQEAEEEVEREEAPGTSIITRAWRRTRKPRRFREEGQGKGQLSPKERNRRKSRAKFKKS